MGRAARGVTGMKLTDGDEICGMCVVDPNTLLLLVTENGYGKRLDFDIDFAIDSSRIDDMKDSHPEITDEAELKKMVLEEYNHSIKSGDGDWSVEGIIVTAKDPKCKKAAELIANIENIFDHEELYC